MLQRESLGRFRSSFLAEKVVAILAIGIPHALGEAYLSIPKDPATNWDTLVAFSQIMNGDDWMAVAPLGKCKGICRTSKTRYRVLGKELKYPDTPLAWYNWGARAFRSSTRYWRTLGIIQDQYQFSEIQEDNREGHLLQFNREE